MLLQQQLDGPLSSPPPDYYEGELNQTSILPCGMLCPFESPRGLEGVLQSMDASLRRTLSMSTALKNATDWERETVSQWSLLRGELSDTDVLSLPAVVCGSQHKTIVTVFHRKECCTDEFLLKGMLYRRVSVERNAVQTSFCWKKCCTDEFLLKECCTDEFLLKGMLYRRVSVERNAVQTVFCWKECCTASFCQY